VDGSVGAGSSANAVGAVGATSSAVKTPIAIGVRSRLENPVGRGAVHEVPTDLSEFPTAPIPLVLTRARPHEALRIRSSKARRGPCGLASAD
jgi:hypothetical protein